tara:strand:+ start:122 stop:262 length:141 start_codon:yes stop_codon:yes gene_type:complete
MIGAIRNMSELCLGFGRMFLIKQRAVAVLGPYSHLESSDSTVSAKL